MASYLSINWFTLFGIIVQEGSILLADAVAIEAGQAVTSPPIVPTIAGHKYSVVISLTPVPGQAKPAPSSINWFQILGLVIEEASAMLAVAEEIVAGQPFSTPPVYVTLAGYKFAAVISGTPVSA